MQIREIINLVEGLVRGVVTNPSPATLQAMIAKTDWLRLLWTPNRLYAWDAELNDHRGMAADLGVSGALRFVTDGKVFAVRPVDTEDNDVTDQSIQAAMNSPSMRFFKDAIDEGTMTFDIG